MADALAFVQEQSRFRPTFDRWAVELLVEHRPISQQTIRVLRGFLKSFTDVRWAPSVIDGPAAVMPAAEGLARCGDPKAAHAGVAILIWMMKTGAPDFDLAAMESSGPEFWKKDPGFKKAMKRANLGRYAFRKLAIEALGRLGPAAAQATSHLEEMAKWKDLRLRPAAVEAMQRMRDVMQGR